MTQETMRPSTLHAGVGWLSKRYHPHVHFVGQHAVDAVVVQFDEPIEAFELVRVHVTNRGQNGRLFVQAHDTPTFGLGRLEHLRVFFGFGEAGCRSPRGGGGSATTPALALATLGFPRRNRACDG